MLTNLLSAVVAAIVNALLGRFFPEHPKVSPDTIAQAQRDRADILESQSNARQEADNLRRDVGDRLAPGGDPSVAPDGVYRHDANERP